MLFLIIFLFVNCSTSQKYFEVIQPFKNYTENPSYLAPINSIKSDYIFRVWFFDSTSVDKVLVVFKNEKNEFESQLISFGKVYDGKKFKEVYSVVDLKPKNGFGNLIEHIKSESVENFQDRKDEELAYDVPLLQYFFEFKSQDKNIFFKYITTNFKGLPENQYSNLIKYLKSEFNLNLKIK